MEVITPPNVPMNTPKSPMVKEPNPWGCSITISLILFIIRLKYNKIKYYIYYKKDVKKEYITIINKLPYLASVRSSSNS